MPTRNSDAPMCSHSVPSCDQLDRASHDLPRRREDRAVRRDDDRPPGGDQHARSPPATEGSSRSLLMSVHRPLAAAPTFASCRARQPSRAHGVAGIRVDDDRHLPAGVRRAGELIAGRQLERQPEALAGHHQRRPEDLRHVVEVPQHENVLTPSVRRIVVGQDLDRVAGHPAGPGALRDLEELVARWRTRSGANAAQPSHDERASAEPGQRDCASAAAARAHSFSRIRRRARSRRACARTASARAAALRGRSGRCTRSARTVVAAGPWSSRAADAVLLAHGGELLRRARAADEGRIEAARYVAHALGVVALGIDGDVDDLEICARRRRASARLRQRRRAWSGRRPGRT